MHNRAVIMSVILFVLVIAGMFTYAYIKRVEMNTEVIPEPEVEGELSEEYDYLTRVEGTHFFIDGVHTVAGEILMPTPCDLLEADVRVAESMPEQITIEFDVVNNAEFCAQVMTPARFMVSTSANEEATWSATFAGRPIELNLVEAAPGETPEDYEVYIKG